MKELTTGGFFEGIGAWPLAAQQQGIKSKWSLEKDERCCRVLRKNFNHRIIEDDIRNVGGHNLEPVDIATGGFPCKQTSNGAAIHGNHKGLDGEDSGLWWEYHRIIKEMGFPWVSIEQPSGIKKWESTIKDSLEDLGYTVSRFQFEASDFGYPHKRRRYIYVANANGKRLEIARPTGSPSTAWVERLTNHGGSWLSSSPGITGVFNGVPDRVDRIEELGNSMIPEIGVEIFKSIKALEVSKYDQ